MKYKWPKRIEEINSKRQGDVFSWPPETTTQTLSQGQALDPVAQQLKGRRLLSEKNVETLCKARGMVDDLIDVSAVALMVIVFCVITSCIAAFCLTAVNWFVTQILQ
jgi:hypothetical protein